MDSLVLGVQLLLAVVFATAGIAKLLDPRGARVALVGFGIPEGAASAVGRLLPLAELAVAAALIPASTARWGAVGAVVLLLAFAAGIANAMARGQSPDCHCFGQLHSAPAGGTTLARNLGLAAIAGFVVSQGPDTEVGDWVAARTAAELAAIGATVAAVALAALWLRLRAENGRLRLALANAVAAREAEPPEPEGLPIGTVAPNFELSDLRGETQSLASLRAGNRPALLVFFDPGCGPCTGLLPHVARWQAALADRLAVAVISEGDPERVRAVWNGHGTDVLLDPDSEVTRSTYHVLTWPSALAIGRNGRIASELVYDQDSMEVLIRAMLENAPEPESAGEPEQMLSSGG